MSLVLSDQAHRGLQYHRSATTATTSEELSHTCQGVHKIVGVGCFKSWVKCSQAQSLLRCVLIVQIDHRQALVPALSSLGTYKRSPDFGPSPVTSNDHRPCSSGVVLKFQGYAGVGRCDCAESFVVLDRVSRLARLNTAKYLHGL